MDKVTNVTELYSVNQPNGCFLLDSDCKRRFHSWRRPVAFELCAHTHTLTHTLDNDAEEDRNSIGVDFFWPRRYVLLT